MLYGSTVSVLVTQVTHTEPDVWTVAPLDI